jgi:extracellular solute-binding protein family 1
MKKKLIGLTLCMSMMAVALAGCGSSSSTAGSKATEAAKADVAKEGASDFTGTIRWLNYKPEIADQLVEVAKAYTDETGVNVQIETAASNTYEQTLTARMDSSDAPTIFVCDSMKMLNEWQDYCADLTNTKLNGFVSDQTYTLKKDDKVYGISYALEGWGIIVNKAITDAYFASPNKKTEYTSLDDLYTFDALKAVVEDMQSMKDELGIEGVFGSTSLKAGDDWRYQTHLMNQPLYWEWGGNDKIDLNGLIPEFKFEYNKNFKDILDLYLNNSVIDKSLVGTKTVDDSMAEFALGKCAMIQNGDWAWSTIAGTDGKKVNDKDVCFIPITCGVEGEKDMGLNVGASQYMCINSQLDQKDQDAALAFLEWLFSSDTGKQLVAQKLQLVTPFTTMADAEYTNPLFESENDIAGKGKKAYCWAANLIPDDQWKNDYGASLLQYAQGQKDWDAVVSDAVTEWETERKITNEAAK